MDRSKPCPPPQATLGGRPSRKYPFRSTLHRNHRHRHTHRHRFLSGPPPPPPPIPSARRSPTVAWTQGRGRLRLRDFGTPRRPTGSTWRQVLSPPRQATPEFRGPRPPLFRAVVAGVKRRRGQRGGQREGRRRRCGRLRMSAAPSKRGQRFSPLLNPPGLRIGDSIL